MAGFEITVVHGGLVVHAVPIGDNPLRLGRASASELVLAEESVSWHHAQVWVEGSRVWVQDLASRNGTFVNDARVRGPTPVSPGDRIRLGEVVILQVRGDVTDTGVRLLQLEDITAGVRFPLRSDRFHIGAGADAHLRLPTGPDRAATLLVHPNGETWLGTDSSERALAVDEVFMVGGRAMRLVESTVSRAPTVEYGSHKYPYVATVTAEGGSGPQVLLADSSKGITKLFIGNRGVLLFVLCSQLLDDRVENSSKEEEGWCSDHDVAVRIWGRGAADSNKLHVLVHRLRKAVSGAGFDPWFIEKRQWGVRVRLRQVDTR